ncbi:MAG: hypothetical protein J6X32_09855 [Salinivirgaceae bacterium]|nr:hypothetical protein [Salinivirgaceae bacterium]
MRNFRFILIPILFFPIFLLWDYALTHNYLTVNYHIPSNYETTIKIADTTLNIDSSCCSMEKYINSEFSCFRVFLLCQEQVALFNIYPDSLNANKSELTLRSYSLKQDEYKYYNCVYDCYPWDFWKTYVRQYLFEKNILDKTGLEYKKDWGNMLIEHWGQLLFNSQWFIYLIIIFFPSISKLFGKIKQMVSQKKQ